jgi:hypothetical protein
MMRSFVKRSVETALILQDDSTDSDGSGNRSGFVKVKVGDFNLAIGLLSN